MALTLIAFALAAGLQTSVAPETPAIEERARVRLVLLPTIVTDRRGRPLRGLAEDSFRIVDEGAPRRIGLFATEESAPVELTFLVDVSESMKLQGRLEGAKEVVRGIVAGLSEGDSAGLIGFADGEVAWLVEPTSDLDALLERLRHVQPGGRTALWDALAASPRLVAGREGGRKAMILLTDGLDNASEIPSLRATWTARRLRVPIYNLSWIPMRLDLAPRRVREGLRLLDRFADETGGAAFTVHKPRDRVAAVRRILSELRFQYVLGFYAPEADLGGSFRRVRVENERKGVTVRTRRGYYP